LANAEDLRAAVTHLLGLVPDAKVLIQKHVHGVELVIGGLRDETLGPVVAFGLGGVLVEVLDDVSFSTAHMDQRMAETLLNQPRGSSILDGVRGSAPVDRSELGRLLASVGRMMSTYPEIMELDLNPIICGMEGAVAVDVRLIRKDVDQQSSAQ
jgi:acetyltransferase